MPERGRAIGPLLAVLAALIALYAWQRWSPEPVAPSAKVARNLAGAWFGPPNAVAVLPFSVDPAQADTADPAAAFALAHDLQRHLAGIEALRVSASTSSFFFADEAGGRRRIAERLGSAWLVTGTAQVVEGRVRLNAALFAADSNSVRWERAYERGLEQLPALLDEVAADVLGVVAPGAASGPPARAVEPGAWLDYAAGLYRVRPGQPPDLVAAEAHFLAALERQPDFGPAHTELAMLYLHPAWPRADGVDGARAALGEALAANPGDARALALQAYVLHHYDWDWQGAATVAREAHGRGPGDAAVLGLASLPLFTLGAADEAAEWLQAAALRDPLNLAVRLRLGLAQEFAGAFDAALLTYRQVAALNPDYPGVHAYRARVKLLQGKARVALAESERETDPFWAVYARTLALGAEDPAEAARLLAGLIEEHGAVAAFQVAEILAWQGDHAAAFEWLERALAQRDAGISASLGNRFLGGLESDPLWPEFLRRAGLPLDAPATAAGQ